MSSGRFTRRLGDSVRPVSPERQESVPEQIEYISPEAEFVLLERELATLERGGDDQAAVLINKLEALEYAYFADGRNLPSALERFGSSVEVWNANLKVLEKQVERDKEQIPQAIELRQSQIKVLDLLSRVVEGGGFNSNDFALARRVFESERALDQPVRKVRPADILSALERNLQISCYQRIAEASRRLIDFVRPEANEVVKMEKARVSPEEQLWKAKKERADLLYAIKDIDTDSPRRRGETEQEHAIRITALHKKRRMLLNAFQQLAGKITRLEAEIFSQGYEIAEPTKTALVAKGRAGKSAAGRAQPAV